jgi:hypothetical protein
MSMFAFKRHRSKNRLRTAPLWLLATAALTACDGASVSETLGMQVAAPDEFTVVSRPPLSIPPEFNLRPPRPGEPPRGVPADESARGLLIGQEPKIKESFESLAEPTTPTAVTPVLTQEAPSGGAAALLKRAGADNAQEDIRAKLGGDVLAPADTSKATSLLEKLSGADKKEPVVDAKKEAERIRNNKDGGKPVTEGDVAVEKEARPSLIDKIF